MTGTRRPSLAEQDAMHGDLAVLADGPWAHHWYWTNELDAMRQTASRHPHTHPAGVLRNYQPTTERRAHPTSPS